MGKQVQLAEEWLGTLLAQQWEGVPDRGAGGTGGVAAGISRDALHAAGVL